MFILTCLFRTKEININEAKTLTKSTTPQEKSSISLQNEEESSSYRQVNYFPGTMNQLQFNN